MTLRDAAAPFARAGYAARGLIYTIIGVFAVLASSGNGANKDTKGALQTILDHAAGNFLAWALIVGLASYALWRFAQALLDTNNNGNSLKGLTIRAALFGSGGVYAVLTVYTIALWHGSAGDGGGGGRFAAMLAGFIGGQIMAWAVAAVFVAIGIGQVMKALKERYARFFDAGPDKMKLIHAVAKTGLIARAVVFWVIAGLFVYRGVSVGEGSDNPGIGAALEFIQGLPAGNILLFLTGIGLLSFAAYSFAAAIWRRIRL